MILHGAPSSKRTWCYSNMQEIGMLDLGKLKKDVRTSKTSSTLTSSPVAYMFANSFSW